MMIGLVKGVMLPVCMIGLLFSQPLLAANDYDVKERLTFTGRSKDVRTSLELIRNTDGTFGYDHLLLYEKLPEHDFLLLNVLGVKYNKLRTGLLFAHNFYTDKSDEIVTFSNGLFCDWSIYSGSKLSFYYYIPFTKNYFGNFQGTSEWKASRRLMGGGGFNLTIGHYDYKAFLQIRTRTFKYSYVSNVRYNSFSLFNLTAGVHVKVNDIAFETGIRTELESNDTVDFEKDFFFINATKPVKGNINAYVNTGYAYSFNNYEDLSFTEKSYIRVGVEVIQSGKKHTTYFVN